MSGGMKHILFTDGAPDAGLGVFQATEDEFGVIFTAGRRREAAAAFLARKGARPGRSILQAIGLRPAPRTDPRRVHGVLVFGGG